MEEIIASLTGMNLNGNTRINVDQLQNVVNKLKKEVKNSFSFAEIIERMAFEVKNGIETHSWNTPEHSTATPPPPSTGGSVGSGDGFMSPSFTFQSPSKPFTPFKVEKSTLNSPLEGLEPDGPFTTNSDTAPSLGNNVSATIPPSNDSTNAHSAPPSFSGFFDAARNSIPSTFDTGDSESESDPIGSSDNHQTTTPDKENAQTNTAGVEQKQPEVGKAWFWGANKSTAPWDVPNLAEKTAHIDLNAGSHEASGSSSDFTLPQPTFSLGIGGSSASKSKRNRTPHNNKSSTLPNINANNGQSSATKNANEPFIFSFKEPAPSAVAADSGFHTFVPGLQQTGSSQKVEKTLFPMAGELEEDDDEMSVDDSPIKSSPFVAPQSHSSGTTTSEKFHQETDMHIKSGGIPIDADIQFNIGIGSDAGGVKSAKKGSVTMRRKDSAKKTTTRPNSATPNNTSGSLFENNGHDGFPDLSFPQNLESMFPKEGIPTSAPEETKVEYETLNSDAPPTWWSEKVNETPRTPMDQQATPEPSFKLPTGPVFGTKPGSQESSRPASARQDSTINNDKLGTASPRRDQESISHMQSLLNLATVYSKQGKEFYSMGLYDQALEAYTRCLSTAPKDWNGRAIVMGNRAAVYFMMHRYMETVNDCDDALRLDPTLVKLYIRKGKSLMCMGHWNPADQAFSRVLEYSSADFLAPKGSVQLDGDGRVVFEDSIAKAKIEAKAGLRDLDKLRDAVKELIGAEASMDWEKVVKLCDEILHKSTMHRTAQISKATALNELSRYEDAKSYIEDITLKTPLNIQSMYAYPRAMFPCPGVPSLAWNEIREPPSVQVDISAVKSMILCMGYELGHVYVTSLKNVKASRTCSADVMMKMVALLNELDTSISNDDKNESWQWVVKELAKLKELISMKNSADQQFKAKSFVAALNSYTAALKLDPTARRWAAILHSNRAATQMSLGLFADAISDCNNAVTKDPDYCRAYLRRARAYRSMNKHNESLRDFRRYLCSDPVPSDFKEVQKELDEMIDMKSKAETKPAAAPSSSSGSTARPTSATGNPNLRSSRDSKFNSNFNPFNRPDGPADDSSRPNSARSTSDWEQKGKTSSGGNYGSYAHNNTYAGYSRPSRAQQQQFHQQQQQQQQQYRSQTQSSNSRFGASWSSNRDFGLGSSDESEEEEIKPKTYYSRTTSSSSKGSFHGSANGSNSNGNSQKASGLFSLKETDHYIVLGVDINASDKDVKVAYRKLALQFHPDKNKDPGAEDRFKMIGLAYSVLSDKAARREYDLTRPLSGRGRR